MKYHSLAKNLSGIYGLTHALTCPAHGALGVALKLGILSLPGPMMTLLETPHRFVTHEIFEPIYEKILDEDPKQHYSIHENLHPRILESLTGTHASHTHACCESSRAERYAHLTTDILGWGSFVTFAGLQIASLYKRRKENKN